jgi:hypothetical protein
MVCKKNLQYFLRYWNILFHPSILVLHYIYTDSLAKQKCFMYELFRYCNTDTAADKMCRPTRRSVQVRSAPRADDMGRATMSQPDHAVRSHRFTHRRDESSNALAARSSSRVCIKVGALTESAIHSNGRTPQRGKGRCYVAMVSTTQSCSARARRQAVASAKWTVPVKSYSLHTLTEHVRLIVWFQHRISSHPASIQRIQLAFSSHSARSHFVLSQFALSSLTAPGSAAHRQLPIFTLWFQLALSTSARIQLESTHPTANGCGYGHAPEMLDTTQHTKYA